MPLDYTKRLNRIAAEAGMFDFTKYQSYYKTEKLIKQYLPVVDKYFEERKYPIRLLVGDKESIGYLVNKCPQLGTIENCTFEEIKTKELSGYKDCTIFIIEENDQKTYAAEIEIYNRHPDCRVCSIYEYMEYNGVNIGYIFWHYHGLLKVLHFFYRKMLSNVKINRFFAPLIERLQPGLDRKLYLTSYLFAEPIFFAHKAFTSEKLDEKERKILLKKLMGYSVWEKDILGLKKYINNYADNFDEKFRKYITEIDKLIVEMKERIACRKQKDIIVQWVDSISNDRLKAEMPFLYNLSREKGSMKSEYAYTCMPYTSPTLKTIMTGKDPIEGRLYDHQLLNDEMELLKTLKQNKYNFSYFGGAYFQDKFIPKRYWGTPSDEERTSISTEQFWNAVNYLAICDDAPCFLLIHGIFETHKPYFCPDSDELYGTHKKEQEITASAWIDKQYEFYVDILGDKSLQIYLGDHGKELDYYAYENNRCNIMFFIKNSNKYLDFSKGLFSLKKFPKLISYLMDWNSDFEDEILEEYTMSFMHDYYSKKLVDNTIKDIELLRDKKRWMQCKIIRNKEFTYALFFDGEEIFLDISNEAENLIDRPEYADTINMMRKKLGTGFIDIWKEDFFVHSRRLYKAYEEMKEKERK